MKTQAEYAEQCRNENPEIVETTNGIQRKLETEEYQITIDAWALMRLLQDNSKNVIQG